MKRRILLWALAVTLAATIPSLHSLSFGVPEAQAQTNILPPLCVGDCNGNGVVTVDETVLLVGTALGTIPVSSCPGVTQVPRIQDLMSAVNSLLLHCPVPITYRLTESSTIIASEGPDSPPPTPQPLTGEFIVVVSSPPAPNALVGLTIMRVDFTGAGDAFSIVGVEPVPAGCSLELSIGCIVASSINPPPIITGMTVQLVINGQPLLVAGQGPFDGPPFGPLFEGSSPPPLNDMQLCGRATPPLRVSCEDIRSGAEPGFLLTIFAVPVSANDFNPVNPYRVTQPPTIQ